MAFAPTALVAPKTQSLPVTKLEIFTLATAPDATVNAGRLVMLTNGSGGSPCLAVSDGVGWFLVAVGAACS